MKNVRILVIDGQGGRIGQRLCAELSALEGVTVTAVGTNSAATQAMLKSGVFDATGENAIAVNSSRADIIVGPVGIIAANSMLGEITPRAAEAVASSDAIRILIPSGKCDTRIAGCRDVSTGVLIESAVEIAKEEIRRLLSE